MSKLCSLLSGSSLSLFPASRALKSVSACPQVRSHKASHLHVSALLPQLWRCKAAGCSPPRAPLPLLPPTAPCHTPVSIQLQVLYSCDWPGMLKRGEKTGFILYVLQLKFNLWAMLSSIPFFFPQACAVHNLLHIRLYKTPPCPSSLKTPQHIPRVYLFICGRNRDLYGAKRAGSGGVQEQCRVPKPSAGSCACEGLIRACRGDIQPFVPVL